MKALITIAAFLTIGVLSFTLTNPFSDEIIQDQAEQNLKLLGELKFNGKGFGTDLQNVLNDAITDSAIYYKGIFYSQTNYIWTRLNGVKQGDWKVVLIGNLSISKITEVSTGFYYSTDNDTWALWYNTSTFAKQTLYLILYTGNTGATNSNVTTFGYKVGGKVLNTTADVINSIVSNLDSAQDIAKYAQKYDGQKWQILSIPYEYGTKNPEAWGTMSVSDNYITYNKNVTIGGAKSSMIMYA